MCGICGALSVTGQPIPDLQRRLNVMCNLLEHRGPDYAGTWTHSNRHVGLGHRRLSIIDLSPAGNQPMRDGKSWVTYGGEIYNHAELRRNLPGSFRSSCDTETLLRAYESWGIGFLTRLRGMFAFAIWDEVKGRLLLARDRFGIKPLYYARVGDIFYFASEAKALLPFTGIKTDFEAMMDYQALQFCLGNKTLFEGIYVLPPAHWLAAGKLPKPVRYWRLEFGLEEPDTTAIRNALLESVSIHQMSDVPVVTYLSGGLDSSTVTSMSGLPSYHGKFREPEYDESKWARMVSRPTEVVMTPSDFMLTISDIIYHLDFPVAGPGAFPQYIVSRAIKEKVVLGGQGGDELCAGYPRMMLTSEEKYLNKINRGPGRSGELRRLLKGEGPLADRITRFEIEGILPALLQVEDRVSMAHGLESRLPFLDHRLAETLVSVPFDQRQNKAALRKAVTWYVPRPIRERADKMGFPVPLNAWLRGPLKNWMLETFPRKITEGFQKTLQIDGLYGRRTWAALSFELWLRRFHDRESEFTQLMEGRR